MPNKNLNYQTNVPADIQYRECLTGRWFNDQAALAQPEILTALSALGGLVLTVVVIMADD